MYEDIGCIILITLVANIAVVKPDKAEKLEMILIQVTNIIASLNKQFYRTHREEPSKAKSLSNS